MTFSHPDIVETEAPEEEITGDEDYKPSPDPSLHRAGNSTYNT